MNCKNCGSYLPSWFNHCPACGKPASKSKSETSAPDQGTYLYYQGHIIHVYVTDMEARRVPVGTFCCPDGTREMVSGIIRSFRVTEEEAHTL